MCSCALSMIWYLATAAADIQQQQQQHRSLRVRADSLALTGRGEEACAIGTERAYLACSLRMNQAPRAVLAASPQEGQHRKQDDAESADRL
jgi:hypothetical protein